MWPVRCVTPTHCVPARVSLHNTFSPHVSCTNCSLVLCFWFRCSLKRSPSGPCVVRLPLSRALRARGHVSASAGLTATVSSKLPHGRHCVDRFGTRRGSTLLWWRAQGCHWLWSYGLSWLRSKICHYWAFAELMCLAVFIATCGKRRSLGPLACLTVTPSSQCKRHAAAVGGVGTAWLLLPVGTVHSLRHTYWCCAEGLSRCLCCDLYGQMPW